MAIDWHQVANFPHLWLSPIYTFLCVARICWHATMTRNMGSRFDLPTDGRLTWDFALRIEPVVINTMSTILDTDKLPPPSHPDTFIFLISATNVQVRPPSSICPFRKAWEENDDNWALFAVCHYRDLNHFHFFYILKINSYYGGSSHFVSYLPLYPDYYGSFPMP